MPHRETGGFVTFRDVEDGLHENLPAATDRGPGTAGQNRRDIAA